MKAAYITQQRGVRSTVLQLARRICSHNDEPTRLPKETGTHSLACRRRAPSGSQTTGRAIRDARRRARFGAAAHDDRAGQSSRRPRRPPTKEWKDERVQNLGSCTLPGSRGGLGVTYMHRALISIPSRVKAYNDLSNPRGTRYSNT